MTETLGEIYQDCFQNARKNVLLFLEHEVKAFYVKTFITITVFNTRGFNQDYF